jgi:uncharacterized membrane protein
VVERSGVQALLLRISAARRLLVVVAVGAVAGVVAGWFVPWQAALLVAWDVAAVTFLTWVWGTIGSFDADETRAFATREDGSRLAAQVLVLFACVASLLGVGAELARASSTGGGEKAALTAVAALTVVLSWALVHTVFALRYAHEYYTDPVGGIDFKSPEAPDYQDFMYVAFTIGMTFQVADTDVQRSTVRRTVIRHALLAYLFGAVILAVTVNVVATLLQ